jgi:chromosome segregation ATPase
VSKPSLQNKAEA